MIEIDGRKKPGPRYLVKIDGREVWLTGTSFRIFVIFAHARWHKPCPLAWVHKSDLSIYAIRYIHRLRGELDNPDLIENSGNKDGYYRLTRGDVRCNNETLKNHEDHDVRKLFAEVA